MHLQFLTVFSSKMLFAFVGSQSSTHRNKPNHVHANNSLSAPKPNASKQMSHICVKPSNVQSVSYDFSSKGCVMVITRVIALLKLNWKTLPFTLPTKCRIPSA